MVDFDKFEKLVKQKYGEQEFPFDEANWEKARTMIDASRKSKNRGAIWLLSAAAVLCTTALVYYFVYSGGSEAINKTKVAVNETQPKAQPLNTEQPEDPKVSGTSTASNVNASNTQETISDSNPASSGNTPHTTPANSNFNQDNSVNPDQGAAVSKAAGSEPANSGNNSRPESKTEQKNNPSSEADHGDTKNTEEKAKHNTDKNSNQQKSATKTKLPGVLGGNNSQNNSKPHSNSNDNSTAANNNKTGIFDNKSSTANNQVAENKPAVADTANNVVLNDAIPVSGSVLRDSSENIKQLPADSFKIPVPAVEAKGDGISYATNVKLEHEHKNFVFMEAGASYMLGWNAGSTNEAGGFNVVAGLNFQHYFTSNFFAQIGVQYNTIGNLSNSTHTITSKNYDLGLQQDVTTITYQKLYYMVAPIKVGLTFRKNNHIGVGCNVGYLMNTDSKMEKYTTYSSAPGATKNNLTSTKETGYVQGFSPFDIQVSAFYRRKIYAGLSANAEFIYGLKDIKENNFFNSGSFDRNIGFKLTLCYDLFKK